jgi:probable rRNA maturation factor
MKISNLLSDSKEFFISVKLSHDKEIRNLNKEYLKRDHPTDVLSFGMNEPQEDGNYYLGDVIVNVDQAQRQAKEYGNNLAEEIAELVEHGVLHLLGKHHEGDDYE